MKSMLSGGIGIPEGGGKLLSRPEESAVQNLVKNEISILNIVDDEPDGGGGGAAQEIWARFKPDATTITGSTTETLTAVRDAEGDYEVTSTKTAGTSGGQYLFGVLCSVSSKAGDGGDGSSPLKAFSAHNVEDTDDLTGECFYANPDKTELFLLGSNSDGVHRHTMPLSGPTLVDAGTHALEPAQYGGCLSKDGDYVLISGKDSTFNIRVLRTSDNTLFDLTDGSGNPTSNMYCVAGRVESGTLYIWVWESSAVTKRSVNLGAETLGAAAITYSSSSGWFGTSGTGGQLQFAWDSNDYLWTVDDATLVQIDPSANAKASHSFPSGVTSAELSRIVYDSIGNRLLILVSDGTDRLLYEFKNWVDLNATSGTFRLLYTFVGGSFIAFDYDPTTGVYWFVNYGGNWIERWIGDPLTLLERVPFADTVADVPIDYAPANGSTAYYKGTRGYTTGSKGGQWYMIEVVYEGDNITSGGGGSFITNFLNIMYEVTSATTAQIRIFDNKTELLRDGEFTVKFIYP